MEKLNRRVKLIYSARVLRLIITHQRRSSVESFTVVFALIEYLCETQINERIVIKRKNIRRYVWKCHNRELAVVFKIIT